MRFKRKIIFRFIAAALIFWLCLWQGKEIRRAFSSLALRQPSINLDAGHGGEDGGAVSDLGVKESVINLELTLCLDQMLGLFGRSSTLLRSSDISLHDDTAVTLREKKVSDLKNRTKAVTSEPSAVLISIHQNSYPEPKYRGTQVFYAPTGGSQALAQAVQRTVVQHIQPENNRQEKLIPDSVYLMNHIENKAILVECGFLTNPDEAQLLQQPEYQRKLALILAHALAEHLEP